MKKTMRIAEYLVISLIAQYALVAILFAGQSNWKKAMYFLACLLKDLSVLLL